VVHAQGAAAGLCFVHLTGTKAAGTARVLSVQDAIRSGEFPESARDALGISEAPSGAFNSADGICLLKGLLSEADAVIAPSDSYARQLQTPERHGALARAFQNASPWGVLSGVDLAIYNPSTDPSLVSRFDAPDPSNKARNKVAVLAELKLDFDPTCPLVFCEITEEGECASPTLLSAISGIVRNDVDLVLSVPASRQKEFASAADTLEGRFKVLVEPAAAARRRLLAAADFYLSIRRNDPFAQQLQQAARYGAIPIAYRVDAVEDAVIDLDAQLKTGTGLLYDVMTQRALTSVVGRAVAVFRNAAYGDLLRRVLRQDAAWDRPARRHVQIYRQAIQP
jgi:starch synthase